MFVSPAILKFRGTEPPEKSGFRKVRFKLPKSPCSSNKELTVPSRNVRIADDSPGIRVVFEYEKLDPLAGQCARTDISQGDKWQPFESPEEWYMIFRLISGRHSHPTRRHGWHGKTYRRSHATNGSVGPYPSRRMRQGGIMSKGCARS
jgi:hypothetical protein